MGLLRFRGREQRIEDQLERAASTAMATLLEQSFDMPDGPFNVPGGRLPRHAEFQAYMGDLQRRTVEKLGVTSLKGSIEWDEEASIEASSTLVEVVAGHSEPVPKKAITLVFARKPVLH